MKTLVYFILAFVLIGSACSVDQPTGNALNNSLSSAGSQPVLAKKAAAPLLKVFKTGQAPVIDGIRDLAWDDFPVNKIANNVEDYELNPIRNVKDISAKFQMIWDDINLYLLVMVKDDELNVSVPEIWLKDGLQIYFDGDNSKNVLAVCDDIWPGAYDENDNQITTPFGADLISYPWPLDFSTSHVAWVQGNNGYTVEIAIPLNILQISSTLNYLFGFDIQMNDNDQGVRQNVLNWSNSEDHCYFINPSLWGTAKLVE